MKLNDHFILQEYVPASTFLAHPTHICLRFVDERILAADTQLKLLLQEFHNEEISITINNWFWGGIRQYSGYRPPGEGPGKPTSTHALAMASDKQFSFKKSKTPIAIADVFGLVMENKADFFALGIRRIEDIDDTPTWLHWDAAYTGMSDIQIVPG